jgi:N-formylglutamate amidohydrolase
LEWPARLGSAPSIDFAANSDFEVHQLYRKASALGIAQVRAIYSRVVVDLNRAADDISPRLVPNHPKPRPRSPGDGYARPGRGVVWASAIDRRGPKRIISQLPFDQFQTRIDDYHTPYYRALELLLERRIQRFGHAILVDAHSMPGRVGADLVLGTLDGRACSPEVAVCARSALEDADGEECRFTLRENHPYRGGEIIRVLGRPTERMHALQLEIDRSLYMDEHSHTLRANRRVDALIARLDRFMTHLVRFEG